MYLMVHELTHVCRWPFQYGSQCGASIQGELHLILRRRILMYAAVQQASTGRYILHNHVYVRAVLTEHDRSTWYKHRYTTTPVLAALISD